MKKHYIINKKIKYTELDNNLYNYPTLTASQVSFYNSNPNASLNEVLNEQLNPVVTYSLEQLKEQKKQFFSQLAFEIREGILPNYKIINAGLGIYTETETLAIKTCIQVFRNEFYRLSDAIDACINETELQAITDEYDSIEL